MPPANAEPDPVRVHLGIDWADRKHEFVLLLPDGQTQPGTLENRPEAIHDFLASLRERFAGEVVAIALEKTRSQLVNILVQYPFVRLYLLNPGSVAKYREALRPAGAKDDPGDAEVILQMLVKHAEQLSPWRPDDQLVRLLHGLCEERRHAVDQRTKLVEELSSKLKRYYPQAHELAGGDLTTTMACDFLLQYSDLDAVKKPGEATLRAFYHTHNSRSATLIDRRLTLRREAVAVTDDPAVIEPLRLAVRRLARQIRDLNADIAAFDRRIEAVFPEHPDAAIFKSFPGAGKVLAPRLLAEFGSDRARYQSASDLQCRAGIAPVTVTSGKSRWVHRRRRCPKFSLQTFHEFAAASLLHSAWAEAYYKHHVATNRDARHHRIVRALAFKWIRIMFACWQNRTTYDEDAYIDTLRKRNSPLCAFLP